MKSLYNPKDGSIYLFFSRSQVERAISFLIPVLYRWGYTDKNIYSAVGDILLEDRKNNRFFFYFPFKNQDIGIEVMHIIKRALEIGGSTADALRVDSFLQRVDPNHQLQKKVH